MHITCDIASNQLSNKVLAGYSTSKKEAEILDKGQFWACGSLIVTYGLYGYMGLYLGM